MRAGGHLVAPGPAGRLHPLLAPAACVVETLHSGEEVLMAGFDGRFKCKLFAQPKPSCTEVRLQTKAEAGGGVLLPGAQASAPGYGRHGPALHTLNITGLAHR